MTLQKQLEYVHPEVLVDTQWVEDHLTDRNVRIAEVDYDSSANYIQNRPHTRCRSI